MTGTTPLLQGQQRQLNDYASFTMAETSLQRGQQLPLQQRQRCLRINNNNAIATRATTPLQWWQGCLRIDDDNVTIATRATTPAWGRQQCHQDEGTTFIVDQGQWHHCYKGNNAISTTTRTPAHQQWQWHHHHEGNNCICINGKNPVHQWQQCHFNKGIDTSSTTSNKGNGTSSTMAETHLRINNSNAIIVRRATIAIGTTGKMPAHWRQQGQLDNKQQGQSHQWWWRRLCNKGNDTSLRMATMPLRRGQ